MSSKTTSILIILASAIMGGCAQTTAQPQPYAPMPPTTGKFAATGVAPNSIRLKAIQDTAFSYGAQSALAWRSRNMDQMLQGEENDLNQIFDFNALMLKNNVLPPVLAEGDDALNMADPFTLRLADKVYKIVHPPRFVTTVPTWRDYLYMTYQKPDSPDFTLLPKTPQEKAAWEQYSSQGWQAGIEQANEIFSANLGRLKRDYAGMILYRKLLAQNMVTPPYVAKADLGITGGGNSMRINDQVLRITAISQLNANAKTWKPLISKGTAGGGDPDVDQVDGP
jgi:defect-in-organelle-trafficking protein DotC